MAYEDKDDVQAYGDNKLANPVPDTVPATDKDCKKLDPDDTVKFPLDNTILLATINPPVILQPPLDTVKPFTFFLLQNL